MKYVVKYKGKNGQESTTHSLWNKDVAEKLAASLNDHPTVEKGSARVVEVPE